MCAIWNFREPGSTVHNCLDYNKGPHVSAVCRGSLHAYTQPHKFDNACCGTQIQPCVIHAQVVKHSNRPQHRTVDSSYMFGVCVCVCVSSQSYRFGVCDSDGGNELYSHLLLLRVFSSPADTSQTKSPLSPAPIATNSHRMKYLIVSSYTAVPRATKLALYATSI